MKEKFIKTNPLLSLVGLALIIFSLPSFTPSQNYERYDISQKLSFEQAESDLNFLLEKLESIHPNLYAYTPKKIINKEKEKILRQFNPPISRMDFAKQVIPLIARLNDGHTFMIFPFEEEEAYSISNGTYFPFDIVICDKKVLIKTSYLNNADIVSGMEIRSVNGLRIEKLLEIMKNYVSGETKHFRLQAVARNFRRFLLHIFEMRSDFTVEFSSGENQRLTKKVPGLTAATIIEKRKQLPSTQNQTNTPFIFSSFKNKGFGGLTINTFDGNLFENFKQFLQKTFEQIRLEKLENLIIDIRRNGGGDTRLVNLFFDYITKKNYTLFEKVEFKISPEVEREPRFADFLKSEEFVKLRKGNFVYWNSNLQKPNNNEFSFNGKVFLLISGQTFSSASDLAAAFKCYKMGTIVGEETGGIGISYGELISVTLPNTKLIANVSSKKFVSPCGKSDLRGIIPDFKIKQKIEDFQRNIDPVMEFVKKRIANK